MYNVIILRLGTVNVSNNSIKEVISLGTALTIVQHSLNHKFNVHTRSKL